MQMMPSGELLYGGSNGRFADQPGLETGKGFVAWGEQAVVLEEAAQM